MTIVHSDRIFCAEFAPECVTNLRNNEDGDGECDGVGWRHPSWQALRPELDGRDSEMHQPSTSIKAL
jgi:hypothetical protein